MLYPSLLSFVLFSFGTTPPISVDNCHQRKPCFLGVALFFFLTSIGILVSPSWYEGNPCNMHLNDLAAKVKEGVEKAGLVGYRFNTIGVSDGISMGTTGMSYSLQSRDIIADSIETVGCHKKKSQKACALLLNICFNCSLSYLVHTSFHNVYLCLFSPR